MLLSSQLYQAKQQAKATSQHFLIGWSSLGLYCGQETESNVATYWTCAWQKSSNKEAKEAASSFTKLSTHPHPMLWFFLLECLEGQILKVLVLQILLLDISSWKNSNKKWSKLELSYTSWAEFDWIYHKKPSLRRCLFLLNLSMIKGKRNKFWKKDQKTTRNCCKTHKSPTPNFKQKSEWLILEPKSLLLQKGKHFGPFLPDSPLLTGKKGSRKVNPYTYQLEVWCFVQRPFNKNA